MEPLRPYRKKIDKKILLKVINRNRFLFIRFCSCLIPSLTSYCIVEIESSCLFTINEAKTLEVAGGLTTTNKYVNIKNLSKRPANQFLKDAIHCIKVCMQVYFNAIH